MFNFEITKYDLFQEKKYAFLVQGFSLILHHKNL